MEYTIDTFKVFLGLGSNVGDSVTYIEDALMALEEVLDGIVVARLYESKAVGYKQQGNFINTAVVGQTTMHPNELLNFIQELETKLGRQRRFRWGPREIDIDILYYENLVLDGDDLTIPHKMIWQRDFVLLPLIDLDPDFLHPVYGKSNQQLYDQLTEFSVLAVYE